MELRATPFDSRKDGICGNSSSVERWYSSQRVGFDSLFPINPYSSDKQKQKH
ncbi:hypothetical protein ACIXR5_12790 [Bacteroides fragilis]|nr:hypothetical protein [Bacteroides fragilis]